MSYDLYFWPAGQPGNPARIAARLADERPGRLRPDPGVLAFRARLLERWPELAARIEPWHHDLGHRPGGRTDLGDRYVVLLLAARWPHREELPELAHEHGLVCYDPQHDAVLAPHLLRAERGADGLVREVSGTVPEESLPTVLRQISDRIGYAYDELDESALIGALDDDGASFSYPLAGSPPLTVHLTRSRLRVVGEMPPALAVRIEALLEP